MKNANQIRDVVLGDKRSVFVFKTAGFFSEKTTYLMLRAHCGPTMPPIYIIKYFSYNTTVSDDFGPHEARVNFQSYSSLDFCRTG